MIDRSIRVLLGVNQSLIRAGLGKVLRDQAALSLVGEVALADLIRTTREQEPDVVIIGAVYPVSRHLSLSRSLLRLPKCPAVMMVSEYARPDFIREFFSIGASACLKTDASIETMLMAIRRIAAGRNYIDSEMSDTIVVALTGTRRRCGGVLSPREEQALELLARGYTMKEAAQKMRVSPSTLDTFRRRIAQKLELRGRADFVGYALARGLLKPDQSDNADLERDGDAAAPH